MDFNWFFKGHFKNNRARDIFPNDEGNEHAGGMQGNDRRHLNDIPFIHPFNTFEDTSVNLFQHMNDMFNQMFSASIETFGPESFNAYTTDESDPRSTMLKHPNCEKCYTSNDIPIEEYTVNPSHMLDSDLDDKVARRGLLLFDSSLKNEKPSFVRSKVSSVRKVQIGDGIFEEQHSFIDNNGNTTKTVRRSIGDQSYEVTTRIDGNGQKEKHENFTNLDENELGNFEEKWKSIKEGREVQSRNIQTNSIIPTFTPPPGDPSYLSLFKKFFGF